MKSLRGIVVAATVIAAAMVAIPSDVSAQKQVAERPQMKVGDKWKMERRDGFTKVVQLNEETIVTGVTPSQTEITIDNQPSQMTMDLSILENSRFKYEAPYDFLKFPLEVGKEWSFKPKWKNKASGQSFSGSFDAEVKEFEKIKTTAGEFDAFKVEAKGYLASSVRVTYWYAPATKSIVKMVWQDRKNDFIAELTEYSLSP